jgi:hypothetical protein
LLPGLQDAGAFQGLKIGNGNPQKYRAVSQTQRNGSQRDETLKKRPCGGVSLLWKVLSANFNMISSFLTTGGTILLERLSIIRQKVHQH